MVNSSYNMSEPLVSVIIHNNPTQTQEEVVLVNTTTNNNTKKNTASENMDTTAVTKISHVAHTDTARAKRHFRNKTCPVTYHF